MDELKPGMRLEFIRAFSAEEVLWFAALTGDRGTHHVEPDQKGRLMLHGLLTATLPTKLGGDLNFIAQDMHFEFLRPAYAGDALTCIGVIDSVSPEPARQIVRFTFTITNPKGKSVLRGSSSGVIRRAA